MLFREGGPSLSNNPTVFDQKFFPKVSQACFSGSSFSGFFSLWGGFLGILFPLGDLNGGF